MRSPAAKPINALALTPDGCRSCFGLEFSVAVQCCKTNALLCCMWQQYAVRIDWILSCVSLSTGKLLMPTAASVKSSLPHHCHRHLTGQCRGADKAPPFLHSLASSLPPPAVPSMKHLVCMLGPAVPAAVMLAPVGHCRHSHHAAQLVLGPSEQKVAILSCAGPHHIDEQHTVADRQLKSAISCTSACSAVHCLGAATCTGSCSSCVCMYDVSVTHAGKLISSLGAQASLLANLPPTPRVLQMAPPAP